MMATGSSHSSNQLQQQVETLSGIVSRHDLDIKGLRRLNSADGKNTDERLVELESKVVELEKRIRILERQ